MGKKFFIFTSVLVSAVLLSSYTAFAELNFKWAPYLRIRHEYWKNIFDMENDTLDNRNFFRIKTSLWGRADFNDDVGLYVKFTNENRPTVYQFNSSTGKKSPRYEIHEVIFDNLYLDIKNFLGLPLDLRVGRQDLASSQYGEGFIIADGTPRDGSATYYFNAVKAAWHVADKNIVEFLWIKTEESDDILPIINQLGGAGQLLNYSDEMAYGIYHKSDAFDNLRWENYYIYKSEEGNRPSPLTDKGKIHTLGSFAKYKFSAWTLKGQFNYQFGDYGNNDREAIGGYVFLERDFKDLLWSPQIGTGLWYTSGDDPDTSKYEGWNELFSTYAWMSEIYNLSYMKETGTGYWTNLFMPKIALIFNPTDKIRLSLWYNYLRANENVAASSLFSGSGKERGYLPQARIDYKFNENVSAYFLAEYFIPKDFYIDNSDEALFLRTQLEFKF